MLECRKDIASFYENDAHLYEVLSRDRDFSLQCEFLGDLITSQKPLRVLELFAGPAYHGIHFARTHQAKVTCIDSSPAMARLASSSGVIDRYLVGLLPQAVWELDPTDEYDLILGLRYSLGYIEPDLLPNFFATLVTRLAPGGCIVLELHNLPMLLNGLEELEIRERQVAMGAEQICCIWPYNKIEWGREDLLAQMVVRIERRQSDRVISIQDYLSTEWIHSIGAIKRVTPPHLSVEVLTDEAGAFLGSEVLVIREQNDV
ncbi:class I SAM-dependent methyltransferase [Chromobacterium piscinae]|uniref:class I SAM-dependent methyltransferase n=1 Tax=Chromobacterium piscinae TaxID=686831 RepID=UPI001E53A5E7|nr:class I SAM-dependent methyltransferase [Chromobacterium piscinae]MCD5327528.1 class I SAM-dependent methyltransferase [Chromobacterium piscinae]